MVQKSRVLFKIHNSTKPFIGGWNFIFQPETNLYSKPAFHLKAWLLIVQNLISGDWFYI